MGAIFTYSLTSSILLCLGYLTYKWLLAGERQYGYNRVILYLIYTLSLLLPALTGIGKNVAIDMTTLCAKDSINTLENLPHDGLSLQEDYILSLDSPEISSLSTIMFILTVIYFVGVLIVTVYTIIGIFHIIKTIRAGEKIKQGKYTLVLINKKEIAPFSWMRYYVISYEDFSNNGEVIAIHERKHLALHHWIDLILAQIMDIFQWYNPAAWLMGDEFKTVHEYQADEAVTSSGANLRQYQDMLIKKAVGTRFQVLANSLNHSKLKKRITMMYKTKSTKTCRMRALVLIPVLGLGIGITEIPAVASVFDSASAVKLFEGNGNKISEISGDRQSEISGDLKKSYNRNEKVSVDNSEEELSVTIAGNETNIFDKNLNDDISEDYTTDTVDNAADTKDDFDSNIGSSATDNISNREQTSNVKEAIKPDKQFAEFPGGLHALYAYMAENLKYPENAYKNNIQGKVTVRFEVKKDGSIGEASVVKSLDPELDAAAIEFVKGFPKWIPGKENGVAIDSFFVLPVTFSIFSTDNDKSTDKSK